MCLWSNVKIDQRAKVYSFFKLVFMMKYSCKVKKKKQAKVFLAVVQEALYWGLCLFVDKMALKKREIFHVRVFVFSQTSLQKYLPYLGHLKTCVNMIKQCDQAYFFLKITLLLLAFRS